MIPVDQQFGYSTDLMTLLNKIASISARALSRALNTLGGSTSSTFVTDISLSGSGMLTLAAFGGSFCSLLFVLRFCYQLFGGYTCFNMFVFLPQVINSFPEAYWIVVLG